ncbi:hypothetical protein BDK51DRAFT_12090, partial [Blyttiomyces helicus]
VVHVKAGRNNTLASLADSQGNVLCMSSAGRCGLRKSNRGTSDAGYQAVARMTELAVELDMAKLTKKKGVHLKIKGFGPGRDQAFRAIRAAGWRIVRITDVSVIRHGGARPRKPRRI